MTAIHPRFIKSGTEELVVLTRAAFDHLMSIAAREDQEDAADAALFDERLTELKHQADAPLPAEVSRLMLDGDGLLTALRHWRGLSSDFLAAKAGMSLNRFRDLEGFLADRRPEEAQKLADALEVDPRWLA